MPILYREAKPNDLGFVLKTWVVSFQMSNTAGIFGIDSYYHAMMPEVRRILARDGVELYVATNPNVGPDLPVDLHGWIAIERDYRRPVRRTVKGRVKRVMAKTNAPLVHYCYVKELYRGYGIARGLFRFAKVDPAQKFYYTCATPLEHKVRRAGKIPGGRWDPAIQRYPKDHRMERTYEGDSASAGPVQ